MKKIESNKMQKKTALLSTAFSLFTDKGFSKTTIADIVSQAGLAKGTFYLYFKDKYDLRDLLIARKTSQLFMDALANLHEHPVEGFENQMFSIIDHIIYALADNHPLLSFISKNLSWGAFKNAYISTSEENEMDFYAYFKDKLAENNYQCDQPELLLFTIVETVGSTCHNCILFNQPVSIEVYIPYLHKLIHSILGIFISNYSD